MFTHGRTPDRPVYHKLTLSGELKMWGGGGGGGAIFEPKTLSMYLKKRTKKIDQAGIRTHDLRVRKTCSLIH